MQYESFFELPLHSCQALSELWVFRQRPQHVCAFVHFFYGLYQKIYCILRRHCFGSNPSLFVQQHIIDFPHSLFQLFHIESMLIVLLFQYYLKLLNFLLVELSQLFIRRFEAFVSFAMDHLLEHFLFLLQLYFLFFILHQYLMCKIESLVLESQIFFELLVLFYESFYLLISF